MNMDMLEREVMLTATFIARPPEESIVTTIPFVTNLRDTHYLVFTVVYER